MSPGLEVSIEFLGDKQISRRILRVGEHAAEAIPLWNSVWRDLMMIERVQFLTEGQHGSGGWEALSESTIREKQRKGFSPWIERASGALFQSLTEPMASGMIFDRTSSWMRFGTAISYAGFQQSGTSKMPQRKLMDLKESERILIVKQIQLFILKGEVVSILSM